MGIPSSVLSFPRPIWDSCTCFFLFKLFNLWLVLRCCMGFSLIVACGLLIAVASRVAERRLWGAKTLVAVACDSVVVAPGL